MFWTGMPRPEPEPTLNETEALYAMVDAFAEQMKRSLHTQMCLGRHGWDMPKDYPSDGLRQALMEHVVKGDPVDVANFAAMLWNRGSGTAAVG